VVEAATAEDVARLKNGHPDLENAPVYPLTLAAAMKVLPFRYKIDETKPFWYSAGRFVRHQPDFLIGLFNQSLFLVTVFLTFRLARRLFDNNVAWLSALLLLGCEMLWRFSVSGLSTMLLLLIFIGLAWVIVFIEEEAREPKRGFRHLLLLSVAGGVLLGLGTLTRYSFGWLVVPVVIFIGLFGGPKRFVLSVTAAGVFVLLLAPWVIRNYSLSGLPFGIATYAPVEATFTFPDFRLQRSLETDMSQINLTMFVHKFMGNTRQILQNDVPRLGGTWATPFFLVGLMLSFRKLAIRRLRYFVLGCLGIFIVVQAMGRTHLSEQSPDVNSENLLILLLPLVLVYGVTVFQVLLDQIAFAVRELRYVVIGLFVALMCLPLLFAFLPPRPSSVNYPPYFPPAIQQTAGFMKETELMMSDVPWAVAWYGNRQCLWLTLNAQDDFFAVNDYMKPIRGLYLTPETMDSRFLSQWVRAGEHSWGSFVLESMLKREIPPTFPLRRSPAGYMPEQLFLTDRDRWKISPEEIKPASPEAEDEKRKAEEAGG